MKKIFFAAIISLVTVICVSATVADPATENYSSSVTATVAGMNEGFDFDTKTLVVVYNLMPQRVKDLCVACYKDIAPRVENSRKSFTYEGVAITPIKTDAGTDLKFTCGGHTVVVKNYSKAEFDRIFGL